MFGKERETMNEAYAGDILGFISNADFRIGDTLSTSPNLSFHEIPRFAPECFAWVKNTTISGYKSFRKGLDQLLAEDIVQAFDLRVNPGGVPLLGAVGPLQFEVLQYRLRDEYNVESSLEQTQWQVMRWSDDADAVAALRDLPHNCTAGTDDKGRPVLLFHSPWAMQYFQEKFPKIALYDSPVIPS
jgi:peptide chain release factor 3